jgi:hypothetical protein
MRTVQILWVICDRAGDHGPMTERSRSVQSRSRKQRHSAMEFSINRRSPSRVDFLPDSRTSGVVQHVVYHMEGMCLGCIARLGSVYACVYQSR